MNCCKSMLRDSSTSPNLVLVSVLWAFSFNAAFELMLLVWRRISVGVICNAKNGWCFV